MHKGQDPKWDGKRRTSLYEGHEYFSTHIEIPERYVLRDLCAFILHSLFLV